jgi:hypothetical protein
VIVYHTHPMADPGTLHVLSLAAAAGRCLCRLLLLSWTWARR